MDLQRLKCNFLHEDAISKTSCATRMNKYNHSNIDDNFDPGGIGDNDLFDNQAELLRTEKASNGHLFNPHC